VHIKPNKLVDCGAVAAVKASAQRHSVREKGIAGNEQLASRPPLALAARPPFGQILTT
jgi:hypothetical protein